MQIAFSLSLYCDCRPPASVILSSAILVRIDCLFLKRFLY